MSQFGPFVAVDLLEKMRSASTSGGMTWVRIKLLMVLQRLVDRGNTVLVIEHNLDVIKSSDWLIDLGPEGGEGGGSIVAQGTPEEIARNKDSYTGAYLRKTLNK